ncbi:major urinary protein 20-like [Dromiciops gliroides]|uniref:major urinary protein 20-like n=1 Tax=Dromiciops gliroides TaxID=33562 RepID=UPI001CC4115D|nr:major urinary protein 20-like [Dromiciops gliroides]
MKLLLLTIGLCMANAFEIDKWADGFKAEKINGRWYSIAVVSDRPEETNPGGLNRFQIYSFQVKENRDIETSIYNNWNDVCQEVNITLTETNFPGQYKINNLKDNSFVMEDTDYKNFLIVYCQIGKNTGVWELFGRNKYLPRIYKMKFETKVISHGLQKRDISYFTETGTLRTELLPDSLQLDFKITDSLKPSHASPILPYLICAFG